MIHILVAGEEHAPGITMLEEQIFPDPWHFNSIEGSIGRDHITTLVATEEGSVVGYLIYYHILNEGEIARVAVAPRYRRQNVGRMLIRTMIERGPLENLTEYSLEVRESNLPARALYESFGFLEEGRRKAYYKEPAEDGLIMWLREVSEFLESE